MDDDQLDGPPPPADVEQGGGDNDPWSEFGARRGPRQPAEGVRIIGADEAAAAIESGQVAPKKPEDELRFGDVPPQPSGPRPSLRFPGDDPSSVSKPPVAGDVLPSKDAMDDRQAAAADAARRWEEALARSSAGRTPPRSTAPLFSDQDDDADDIFGSTRRRMDTPSPPPTGPPTGPPPASFGSNWLDDDDDLDLLAPPGPPSGPPDYGSWAGQDDYGARDPQAGPPTGPPPFEPAYDPSKYESAGSGSGSYDPASYDPAGYEPASYEPASMQHWTEPPSGEVPKILIGDDEPQEQSDEDLSAWGSLGARPRWRDQPTDWEEADFSEAILADEGHRVGALRSKQGESAPFSFDDVEDEAPTAPPPPGFERSGGRVTPVGRARISTLPSGAPPMPPGGVGGGGGKDGRDLSTRVVTGAVAAGVLLVAAAIGPGAMVFLVAVALTMASAELYQGLRTRGYHPATLLGLVATASLVGAVYWRKLDAYPLVLALFVVFTLLWYLTGVVRARPAMNVAVTLMVFLYVSFLGSFAALILAFGRPGTRILLGAILATVANDIGAYFVGRSLGKTPLAPAVSPNKTVEGLVGATIVTLLVCLVIVSNIDPWDGGKAFWLALVVSAAAPLGDLSESMIKRDLGVKDMGNILPGHGGVLDRIDALLFVIPATYALVRVVFF